MKKNVPQVQFHINDLGIITIELNSEKAPKSVANFLTYVASGYYDGTIFHRVIKDFMIQGGGFLTGMHQKETFDPIENEANNGLKNEPYTIAMARTNDPHSATSQFFINVADNKFLNYTASEQSSWGYAVFGKIIDGIDVVDEISMVSTGQKGHHSDVPKQDIAIIKALQTE